MAPIKVSLSTYTSMLTLIKCALCLISDHRSTADAVSYKL